MNNLNLKTIGLLVLMAVVGGIVGGIIGGVGKVPAPLGATVYNRAISFDAGILVNQTERISSTGGASFTTLTASGESKLDTVIQGGDVTTLTATDTAQTLTAAQFCDSSLIRWDSSGAVSTLTLPLSSASIADCITASGDKKLSILYENYGGETTTIAVASTTFDTLLEPIGSAVEIIGGGWAWISAVVRSATTVAYTIEELRDAD